MSRPQLCSTPQTTRLLILYFNPVCWFSSSLLVINVITSWLVTAGQNGTHGTGTCPNAPGGQMPPCHDFDKNEQCLMYVHICSVYLLLLLQWIIQIHTVLAAAVTRCSLHVDLFSLFYGNQKTHNIFFLCAPALPFLHLISVLFLIAPIDEFY